MAKLLLVEDDNNLREIYEARLQAEGYVIVTAKDGEEALVVAKAEKPDLIISDVMMPKISGFEMLDILRNTEGLKTVKVIMLTALGQADDQQRAERLGADRYLVKSQVTLEDIVTAAHELLQDTATPAAATPSTPDTVSATGASNSEPTPTPPAVSSVITPTVDPIVDEPDPVTPAETVIPEPIAPAPAVTEPPVSESAPTPTAAAPVTNSDTVQSAAEEEASIEAKIEDFVAGASSDPNPPATSAADSQTDDALMATAVQDLADSATPTATTTAPPVAPDSTIPEPVAVEPVTTEPKPEPATGGSVPIANKKIIMPIETPAKPDIQELAAVEDIAEKAAAGPPPPTAIIATDAEGGQAVPLATPPKISLAASGTQPAVAPEQPVDDPNSIAL